MNRKKTTIEGSPFALLSASVRDDRRRIIELADERSLELDDAVCLSARSDLTNPRTRLATEVAWLPGVSPNRALQLIESLSIDPMAVRSEVGLPALAELNLRASAFETLNGNHDADDFVELIGEIAEILEDLDPEDIMRDINEDRLISGFPEVFKVDQIESELLERKRFCRRVIKEALDKLPPEILIQVMTSTVAGATWDGTEHAHGLIDDLVDGYEVETQSFLQKEADGVEKLIQAIRQSVGSGEAAVQPYIEKLCNITRNWDKVAQPIQLSAMSRGLDHEPSQTVAFSIRSLAIDLFNEHDMLDHSKRLTDLLKELFSEVPEVADRVQKDSEALSEIFDSRNQAVEKNEEWKREISYSATVGLIFKEVLSISAEGVVWKGRRHPLESISRVRWGGISRSVNGVPTGTTYTIAFGNQTSEVVIDVRRQETYQIFTSKLWRAVGVRILGDIIETLKKGETIRFGNARINDGGVFLEIGRRGWFGSGEQSLVSWDKVQTWNADGTFWIGAKDNKKAIVGISYINDANAHIFEQIISMAFKKPGLRRLSELVS